MDILSSEVKNGTFELMFNIYLFFEHFLYVYSSFLLANCAQGPCPQSQPGLVVLFRLICTGETSAFYAGPMLINILRPAVKDPV